MRFSGAEWGIFSVKVVNHVGWFGVGDAENRGGGHEKWSLSNDVLMPTGAMIKEAPRLQGSVITLLVEFLQIM